MNIISTLRNYVKVMLSDFEGSKVLLLDTYTNKLMSIIYSHSEILKHDVLLVDLLNNEKRDKITDLHCFIFVQPTNKNTRCIKEELQNPKYKGYSIFFTNLIDEEILLPIAEGDKKQLVHKVKEIFCDYFCPDEHTFTLRVPSVNPCYFNYGEEIFDRIVSGLLSAIVSTCKEKPFLRYQSRSKECKRIVESLHNKLNGENVSNLFKKAQRGTVLLIVDRRQDPITPLLHQWTYQSMVHELVGKHGIRENIIQIKQKQLTEDDLKKPKNKEILFSPILDEFLYKNRHKNWGDLCLEIKTLVDRFKGKVDSTANFNSLDDIRHFLDNYQDFQKLNREVDNHVEIVYHLRDIIKKRNLLQLSKIEQEIYNNGENLSENYKNVMNVLSQRIRKDDALKLSLLFLLRYENDPKIKEIVRFLKEKSFQKKDLKILNGMLMYSGEKVRNNTKELFPGGKQVGGIKGIFKRVKSALKDVENVYTLHKPLISKQFEDLLKGEISSGRFPYHGLTMAQHAKPRKVIIFCFGGITFEEIKVCHELKKGGLDVTLGGTRTLNSRSFLNEVRQFQNQKESSQYNKIDIDD